MWIITENSDPFPCTSSKRPKNMQTEMDLFYVTWEGGPLAPTEANVITMDSSSISYVAYFFAFSCINRLPHKLLPVSSLPAYLLTKKWSSISSFNDDELANLFSSWLARTVYVMEHFYVLLLMITLGMPHVTMRCSQCADHNAMVTRQWSRCNG